MSKKAAQELEKRHKDCKELQLALYRAGIDINLVHTKNLLRQIQLYLDINPEMIVSKASIIAMQLLRKKKVPFKSKALKNLADRCSKEMTDGIISLSFREYDYAKKEEK